MIDYMRWIVYPVNGLFFYVRGGPPLLLIIMNNMIKNKTPWYVHIY